jgi:hypothetical protein
MTITKGSGQGSGGKGLLITALTEATAQTVHTAVAGTATTQLLGLFAVNNGTTAVDLTLVFDPNDGSANVLITETIPARSGLYQLTNQDASEVAVPINDTMVVKAYASVASQVSVWALIGDQASAGQKAVLQSGEITAVQNDNAFRTNGVASSNVEADHQVMIGVAGVLTNLHARALAAVGGGATCTMTIRVNGAGTALTQQFDNADGTTMKSDTDQVAVAAGDLVTFLLETDNAGAPAATFQASVDFIPAA